jgi:putative transposase
MARPTAAWTLRQLREGLKYEDRYRYLIHDRDSIFAKSVDESIERLALKVVKSSLRSPRPTPGCDSQRLESVSIPRSAMSIAGL